MGAQGAGWHPQVGRVLTCQLVSELQEKGNFGLKRLASCIMGCLVNSEFPITQRVPLEPRGLGSGKGPLMSCQTLQPTQC